MPDSLGNIERFLKMDNLHNKKKNLADLSYIIIKKIDSNQGKYYTYVKDRQQS